MALSKITTEDVNTFLNGHDPMEHIVSIECDYSEDMVNIIYVNEKGEKRIKKDDFKPFLWAKNSAAIRLFGGDRKTILSKMRRYGIKVKLLTTSDGVSKPNDRLENGYKYLFYATKKMSNAVFTRFFQEGGVPIHEKKKGETIADSTREYMTVTPVEQYMIASGRRLFKGYESYNQLNRFIFDLETQGLNPLVHRIEQIGIHTNKGFEKVISVEGRTKEELDHNELVAIDEFLKTLSMLKPDTVVGHNSENFDWDFLIVRARQLGSDFSEMSKKYFRNKIYKKEKESVLKLGGEVEYYKPTIMWGHNVLDSLHASRRAQAIDSNMKSSNLKYLTKYLKINKVNRVYVQGDKISSTWNDKINSYGFCEEDGDWYKITKERPLLDGYREVSGKYVVERYLLDDLWETDKVEEILNESNFLVGKMLPTTFTRACTMGTAGIWKLIMLAWSYENGLAIPAFGENKRFVGGLSRLLKVGFVDRIVKLDFNSLYPSVILTWNILNDVDFSYVLNTMLNYVLTQREKYKELKAEAGEKADELKKTITDDMPSDRKKKIEEEIGYWKGEKSRNDKKQLPLKILGNSYFGSAGSPSIFPWGNLVAAEKTTCISRMMLRLMISHFKSIGYLPIVGDTDGFNFQMPNNDEFRYTDEHPYISDGGGRNSVKGKAYTKVEADVAEFEDLFLNKAYNNGVNKSGLGVDEYCDACIQFSRKNYADLMPDGSIKKVGNTIKSRKMSGYLECFIDEGVDMLLHGNGYKFLSAYYDYIEKIYNYQIPLKDIASKGNIKKTLGEYKADCKTTTKAGTKKSRQAWYELAIKDGLNVNVSDTIYYINTGTKKGHSDVKRVTHYYVFGADGSKNEITKEVEKLYKDNSKNGLSIENSRIIKKSRLELAKENWNGMKVVEEDEIILNCKIVPNEIIDSERDILCSEVEGMEYNVEKYIDMFNKRISPLLVCFSRDVRDKVLITNPKDKMFFTEEEAKLISGEPYKEEDQDTYEALMTPERKEIEFWSKIDETPPFVKECGIDWDMLLENYKKEKESEDNALYKEEDEKYLEILSNLTKDDVADFENDGKLPKKILDMMVLGSDLKLYFKKIPNKTPSTGGFIFDDIVYNTIDNVEDGDFAS